MTTATEALFTPVQYFTALDPYNWRVDNRPLSDLSDNDVTLSEGIETAFHAGKLNSAALGSLIRALSGVSPSMIGRLSLSGVALTATIEYSVFTSQSAEGGKTVNLVGLQPDAVNFALTAPAAGYKKLYTISAKYQAPDTDLPYFDSGLPLDATQIPTGNLEYNVTSNTVFLAAGDTYPAPGPLFVEVLHIKVLATDTIINPNNVVYQYFIPEGQAFNYASQTRAGQVLFANPTEVTAGTSTTKAVTPADLKDRIDAIPQATDDTFGIVQFADSAEVIAGTATDRVVTPADLKGRINAIPVPTLDFVTIEDGVKHGINANLSSAPTLLDTGDDLNDIRHSGTWFVRGSCANKPPHASDGILTVDGHDGASDGGNSFWIQRYADFQGHQYSRYIYSIMLGTMTWRFDPWEEAFTGYRLVLVTVAPSVSTTVVITGDDFSSHTMFVCHTSAGSTLNFSLNTPSLATVRNGKSVHIRWGSGPVAPTVLDTPAKLSPAGNYSLRTNGSTISLVRDTTVSSKVMVIGEMP